MNVFEQTKVGRPPVSNLPSTGKGRNEGNKREEERDNLSLSYTNG